MDPYKATFVVLFFGLITAAAPASSGTPACDFPAIFNFGDSNSDTGGLSAAFGQAGPPVGETFFHHPAGRVCDGRLIIDFMAESLGLPYLSAFLDSVGSNFSHGANFATAGSPIRPSNQTLRQSAFSPISLDVQSNQFHDFVNRSQIARARGGVYLELLPKQDHFARALYTFDIGHNDLVSAYFLNMTTPQVLAQIPDILSQYKVAIKSVYSLGGRHFWIHGAGPIGCLGYVLTRVPTTKYDKAGCAVLVNRAALWFNRGVKRMVRELKHELPLAAITYVDVYSPKYELIRHAKSHGFKEAITACCGSGGKYNYSKELFCGTKMKKPDGTTVELKSCEDPSVYVNWDGIHFTEAANKLIFEQIVDGKFSDPPLPLSMACLRKE
ncbi:GDSL esterase/lipase At3g26430 [Linum grandiflorum]